MPGSTHAPRAPRWHIAPDPCALPDPDALGHLIQHRLTLTGVSARREIASTAVARTLRSDVPLEFDALLARRGALEGCARSNALGRPRCGKIGACLQSF